MLPAPLGNCPKYMAILRVLPDALRDNPAAYFRYADRETSGVIRANKFIRASGSKFKGGGKTYLGGNE